MEGEKMSVYIIAEAGVNHNGQLELAKQLVDMAVDCGANAIKFQTFKAEESTGAFAKKAKYQQDNMKCEESQLDMIKKLELSFESFIEIQKYCELKGIDFISTPDGSDSLKFLESLSMPFIKVGSTEVTNLEFLKEIGNTGLSIILSTGMSYLGEVEKAINTIISTGNEKIRLMHCTTDYPTAYKDVNLLAMVTLKDSFKFPVGLSDHTIGIEAAISAVALGAEFIEKHITLNKNMIGPDHKASMEFDEFKLYVQSIRNTELLLGDGIKKPTEREKLIMREVRRSIVAAESINKGTIIDKSVIAFKRPGYGIKPEFVDIVIGSYINRDLRKDEVISWNDLFYQNDR